MIPARAEALFDDLGAVRAGASAFVTNFFATPGDVQLWLDRGVLRVEETAGARLILRADSDFLHLYHWAASLSALREALASRLPALVASTLVVDLIGAANGIEAIERVYRDAGFKEHRVLARMTRASQVPVAGAAFSPMVRRATRDDVPRIDVFFRRLLDPYSEQVPEVAELGRFVDGGSTLIVDRGTDVAGVLIFDGKAMAATLRYWWLAPEYRDQGIGGALIKAMFHEARDARRIQLWVVADNADSIAKYEHYGFRRDGLVDRIMIKQGAAQ